MVMENAILIFVSLCVISVVTFIVGFLDYIVNHRRHLLRTELRKRYIIKKPSCFLRWSQGLSLVEVSRNLKLLDGEHILEELEGVLLPR